VCPEERAIGAGSAGVIVDGNKREEIIDLAKTPVGEMIKDIHRNGEAGNEHRSGFSPEKRCSEYVISSS
jgi:hypothetical protein